MATHSCQYTKHRVPFGHGWSMWGLMWFRNLWNFSFFSLIIEPRYLWLAQHVAFASTHRPLSFSLNTSNVQGEGNVVMNRLYLCFYGHLYKRVSMRVIVCKRICTWNWDTRMRTWNHHRVGAVAVSWNSFAWIFTIWHLCHEPYCSYAYKHRPKPVKGSSSDLVLHVSNIWGLFTDRFGNEWSNCNKYRLRYPDL